MVDRKIAHILRGKVLVFVGFVGAGKTTLTSLMAYYLNHANKVSAKRTYLKTIWIVTPLLLKLFGKVCNNINALFKIHRFCVYVDLSLNVMGLPLLGLLRIRIPRRLGKVVLVEEYLPGIVVDYLHALKILKLNREIILTLMKALYKALDTKNSIIIYLKAPLSSLPQRWVLRGDRRFERITYLRVQSLVFDIWTKSFKSIEVITHKRAPLDVVQDIIKKFTSYEDRHNCS